MSYNEDGEHYEEFIMYVAPRGVQGDGVEIRYQRPVYGIELTNPQMLERYIKINQRWINEYVFEERDGIQLYKGPGR